MVVVLNKIVHLVVIVYLISTYCGVQDWAESPVKYSIPFYDRLKMAFVLFWAIIN